MLFRPLFTCAHVRNVSVASLTAAVFCNRPLATMASSATDAALAARLANAAPAKPFDAPKNPTSIYDFTVHGIQEAEVPLSRYTGRVCMYVAPLCALWGECAHASLCGYCGSVVNVASY